MLSRRKRRAEIEARLAEIDFAAAEAERVRAAAAEAANRAAALFQAVADWEAREGASLRVTVAEEAAVACDVDLAVALRHVEVVSIVIRAEMARRGISIF